MLKRGLIALFVFVTLVNKINPYQKVNKYYYGYKYSSLSVSYK